MTCNCNNENPERRTKRLSILMPVGCLLLILPVLSLLLDFQCLLMKYRTRITPGSRMYEILSRENVGPLVQVYVFNITNAEAFFSGEDILRVEEVGPFTYQEYRKNEDLQVDEEAEVMRYRPIIKTKFLQDMSINDPELINVTVPNAAMLAMTSTITSYPYWANEGYNELIDRSGSKSIITTSVHSYLWGYDDPLVTMFQDMMLGWINFSKMGVLDRLYDQSNAQFLEVSIATEDKFQVKRIDGIPGLVEREYDYINKRTNCNSLVDTYEGYAYPPRLKPNNPLRLYRNTFCRMLNLNYIGIKRTDIAPEAFIYELSNNSYSLDPSTACLCEHENKCTDGVSDISPCLFGLSFALSNGHFLYSNPKIYEHIEGIHPNKDEHGSEFVVEPNLGAVISAKHTLQVNVIVKNITYNSQLKPFSGLIIPLMYLKIVSELPEEDKKHIKISNYVLPYIFHTLEVMAFIIALLIFAYSSYHVYFCCHNIHLSRKNKNTSGSTDAGMDFEMRKNQLETKV